MIKFYKIIILLLLFFSTVLYSGSITNVTIDLQSNVTDAWTIYSFYLTPENAIPSDGRFLFQFEDIGIDFSQVVMASSDPSLMNGGFRAVPDASNHSVSVRRDGTGTQVAGNANVVIHIGLIGNPNTPIINSQVNISTLNFSDDIIDTGTGDFSVYGPIHSFGFSSFGFSEIDAGTLFGLEILDAEDQGGNPSSGWILTTLENGDGVSPDGTPAELNPIYVKSGISQNNEQKLYNAEKNIRIKGTVSNGNATALTDFITIKSAFLDTFNIQGYPSSAQAGQAFPDSVTILAQDPYGNIVSDYTGTVQFFSSDPSPVLPSNTVFTLSDQGRIAFSGDQFKLSDATGNQTISVQDVDSPSIIGQTEEIFVSDSPLYTFDVTIASPIFAGEPVTVSVTNFSLNGNPLNGTVNLNFSDDASNHISPNGTSPILNDIIIQNGRGSTSIVLTKSESNISLRATSAGASDEIINISTVQPGKLGKFTIEGYPDRISSNINFSDPIIVTAFDGYGNLKTNYTGSIVFTSETDPNASLPAGPYLFSNETREFAGNLFKFRQAGLQTFKVVDNTNNIQAVTDPIRVDPIYIEQLGILAGGDTNIGHGQLDVPIYMDVKNYDSNDFIIQSANLQFEDQSGYNVSNHFDAEFQANVVQVPGGGSYATLHFLVDVDNNVAPGQISVTGNIQGTLNGVSTSATYNNNPISLVVYKKPTLDINRIEVLSDTVYQQQNDVLVQVEISSTDDSQYVPEVTIRNTMDYASFIFEDENNAPISAGSFTLAPHPENDSTLAPGESNILRYFMDVSETAYTGLVNMYNVTTFIDNVSGIVRKVGRSYGDNEKDTFYSLIKPNIVIENILTSQDYITRGQTSNWNVSVIVRNNGLSPINVDFSPGKTFLEFQNGTSMDPGFTIDYPTSFDEGGTFIDTGESKTLIFTITQSSNQTGSVVIVATVETTAGISTNSHLSKEYGSIVVQQPENIKIKQILPSQTTITVGEQNHTWNVRVILSNEGESEVEIDFSQTTLNLPVSEFIVTPPTSFTSLQTTLKENETDTLLYSIQSKSSATQTGSLNIGITIAYRVLNTNTSKSFTAPQDIQPTLDLQEPPDLEIIDIHPSREFISFGTESDWWVTVVLQNNGGAGAKIDFDSTETYIQFNEKNTGAPQFIPYTTPFYLASSDSIVQGGTQDSIVFNILDLPNNAEKNLNIISRIRFSDVNVPQSFTSIVSENQDQIGSLILQTPPQITYSTNSLSPTYVSPGTFYKFQVNLVNSGEANLNLNAQQTIFNLQGTSFSTPLQSNFSTVINGNSTAEIIFTADQIPNDLPKGEYTPQIIVKGTENGNDYTEEFVISQEKVTVGDPSELSITYVSPDVNYVTAGQTKAWNIMVGLKNSGANIFNIDSAKVQFYYTVTDVSSLFDAATVYAFTDGGQTIAPDSEEDMVIPVNGVDNNAPKSAPILITAKVWLNEGPQPENQVIVESEQNTAGYVIVQSPAELLIKNITTSQSNVTIGQDTPWSVLVHLENTGGSSLRIIAHPDSTFLNFDKGNEQFIVQQPAEITLSPGMSDSIEFNIQSVPADPFIKGLATIHANIAASEINSQKIYAIDRYEDGTPAETQIVVQDSALVRLDSLVADIPNYPYINTNQKFNIKTKASNPGNGDMVEYLKIGINDLSGNNFVFENTDSTYIDSIASGESKWSEQIVPVRAPLEASEDNLFTARITKSIARNTGESVRILPPTSESDTSLVLNVQRPGELVLDSLWTIEQTIPAGIIEPWSIFAKVKNTGSGKIIVQEPTSSDIQVDKPGYVISAKSISESQREIAGGDSLILEYIVDITGPGSGEVNILATISAMDKNDTTRVIPTESRSTKVLVQTTSRVRLEKTFLDPDQYNVGPGDTAHVNINQEITVSVRVKNEGGQRLDSVWVRLSTESSDIVGSDSAFVTNVDIGEYKSINFRIRVDEQENLITGEKFTAEIMRAVGRDGGLAIINPLLNPFDNTCIIKIYNPGILEISGTQNIAPNSPFVSLNQTFFIKVELSNLGSESIRDVFVQLNAIPAEMVVINDKIKQLSSPLSGDSTQSILFQVTAKQLFGDVQFKTSVTQAIGANTKKAASVTIPENNDSTFATLQVPAQLSIDDITTSTQEVVAGDDKNNWNIYIRVRNTGGAPLKFFDLSPKDIEFITNGEPKSDFEVRPPVELENSGDLVLQSGVEDTLKYVVSETGKTAGQTQINVTLKAHDLNVGPESVLSESGNVYILITSRAWVRIERTFITTNVVGKDGAYLVNRDQRFELQITLETSELVGVDNIELLVSSNGKSLRADTTVVIDRIQSGNFHTQVFELKADNTWPQTQGEVIETFTASILSAKAQGSSLLAQIREPGPGDAEAKLRIQVPAKLSVSLGMDESTGSILPFDQNFNVIARVDNQGFSPIGDGTVQLTPPEGYLVENQSGGWSVDPVSRTFELPDGQRTMDLTFKLKSPPEESRDDIIKLNLLEPYPEDLNNQNTVPTDQEQDELIVSTVDAELAINSIEISWPEGAKDSVLSTNQRFKLKAQFFAADNIDNLSAKLIPPSILTYNVPSPTITGITSSAEWEIEAPAQSVASSHNFRVEIEGESPMGKLTAVDTISIKRVEKRATLFLENLEISSPSSVMQNGEAIFSTNQQAVLRTRVINMGTANVVGRGKVKIDFFASGLELVDPFESLEREFDVGSVLEWQIKAPSIPKTPQEITARITEIPLDENTNSPAFATRTSFDLRVRTRQKGDIEIARFDISEPAGAKDSTLSTEQRFVIQAEINTDPELVRDGLTARIHFSRPQFLVPGGHTIFINHGINKIGQWVIEAPNEVIIGTDQIWITVSGYDLRSGDEISTQSARMEVVVEQKSQFNLVPDISFPEGLTDLVSTDQEFHLKATFNHEGADFHDNDKFAIQLEKPPEYTLLGDNLYQSFSGSSVTWSLRAPSEPPAGLSVFTFNVISVPRDINSDTTSSIQNKRINFSIQTVEKTKLVLNAYLDVENRISKGSVRVGSEFIVTSVLENRGDAAFEGEYEATLKLPETGYTTSEELTKVISGKRSNWKIQTPRQLLSSPDTILIILTEFPIDEYSKQEAEVLQDTAKVIVNTEAGMVVVRDYPVRTGSVVQTGEKDVPMMGLILKNRDLGASTTTIFRGLKLTFTSKTGKVIAPSSVVSRVAVAHHSDKSKVYGQSTNLNHAGPININFSTLRPDTIIGTRSDSINILVDILSQNNANDFVVTIDSSSYIQVYDAFSDYPVTIGDMTGTPLSYLGLKSETAVLVEQNLEKTFFNYPNPFGTSSRPRTKFVYSLDQQSDIEIKIFTLTGELVKTWEFNKDQHFHQTTTGIHEGDVEWDGTNGRGIRVNNGIYIAYIQVKSSGKVAKTKIAVVK